VVGVFFLLLVFLIPFIVYIRHRHCNHNNPCCATYPCSKKSDVEAIVMTETRPPIHRAPAGGRGIEVTPGASGSRHPDISTTDNDELSQNKPACNKHGMQLPASVMPETDQTRVKSRFGSLGSVVQSYLGQGKGGGKSSQNILKPAISYSIMSDVTDSDSVHTAGDSSVASTERMDRRRVVEHPPAAQSTGPQLASRDQTAVGPDSRTDNPRQDKSPVKTGKEQRKEKKAQKEAAEREKKAEKEAAGREKKAQKEAAEKEKKAQKEAVERAKQKAAEQAKKAKKDAAEKEKKEKKEAVEKEKKAKKHAAEEGKPASKDECQKTKPPTQTKDPHSKRVNAANPAEGNPANPAEGNPTEGTPAEGNTDELNTGEGNPDEGNPDEGTRTAAPHSPMSSHSGTKKPRGRHRHYNTPTSPATAGSPKVTRRPRTRAATKSAEGVEKVRGQEPPPIPVRNLSRDFWAAFTQETHGDAANAAPASPQGAASPVNDTTTPLSPKAGGESSTRLIQFSTPASSTKTLSGQYSELSNSTTPSQVIRLNERSYLNESGDSPQSRQCIWAESGSSVSFTETDL
jgi:hypothetical protein